MSVRQEPPPSEEVVTAIALAVFIGREHGLGAVAEHLLARAGATSAHLQRALWLALTPPEEVAEHERRVGQVILAMRVPGLAVDEVEVTERVADETADRRLTRASDQGWFDAILGRPAALRTPVEQAAYDSGRRDFERIAAVFSLAQDALQAAANDQLPHQAGEAQR